MKAKRVAILGSTGSIGRQTLDVIAGQGGATAPVAGGAALCACALAAGANWQLLAEQARQVNPGFVAITDAAAESQLRGALPAGTQLLVGDDAMSNLVRLSRPDIVLNGVVGAAGLAPTLAAIGQGCPVAIANKETLVMAGAIVMPLARAGGVPVLPVDSEHSAIFQCLASGKPSEVRRVVITASGGALRDLDEQAAHDATVAQALNHPTWQMGRKITIDSATLMNKALEVIEAHWLFGLGPEQIEVVIHPESIIHSLVEFCDGSVIAQLARPDMTMPIAYALNYPDRPVRDVPPLDLAALGMLTFKPLTPRFGRAVNLAYAVIRRGGLSGAVLNAANEAAVQAFLEERISLGHLVPIVEDILNRAPAAGELSLAGLMQADSWARQQVAEAVETSGRSRGLQKT